VKPIYVIDAVRSGFAPAGGALTQLRLEDLLLQLTVSMIDRRGISAEQIADFVLGCAIQEDEQGMNLARQAMLLMSSNILGVTLSRMELSGFDALQYAGYLCQRESGFLLAGACEKMAISGASVAGRANHPDLVKANDGRLAPTLISASDFCQRFGWKRTELDDLVLDQHAKAVKAQDEGFFDPELVELKWSERSIVANKLEDLNCSLGSDENPREDLSMETLAACARISPRSEVLSSSHVGTPSDGGVMFLLGSEQTVKGHEPLGKILAIRHFSHSPTKRGLDLCFFAEQVIKEFGLRVDDMDLVQTCDATVVSAMLFRERWQGRSDIFNVDGGLLALGNAMSAGGMGLLAHMFYSLRRRTGRYGLLVQDGTLGQSSVVLVEAL
jgi:acetyl-CoA acyltransferase